jgi:hypothetical protein
VSSPAPWAKYKLYRHPLARLAEWVSGDRLVLHEEDGRCAA